MVQLQRATARCRQRYSGKAVQGAAGVLVRAWGQQNLLQAASQAGAGPACPMRVLPASRPSRLRELPFKLPSLQGQKGDMEGDMDGKVESHRTIGGGGGGRELHPLSRVDVSQRGAVRRGEALKAGLGLGLGLGSGLGIGLELGLGIGWVFTGKS